MPRYSPDDTIHDFVALLVSAVDRWHPYQLAGQALGPTRIVEVVRWRFGEAAARSVHIAVH